jgi:AraC family transcriptional regulator
MDVEIRTLAAKRVAYMRHVGPYGASSIAEMWQRFTKWCALEGLMSPPRPMYGISQDTPGVTAPHKLRYDACIEVDDAFVPKDDIGVEMIWGGTYACAKFSGTAADIQGAWLRFIDGWLPDSRYELEPHPPLELYGPDDTVDPKTGAFTCELCAPVKPR